MNEDKRQLLEWLDNERDRLITFLSEFVQAKARVRMCCQPTIA